MTDDELRHRAGDERLTAYERADAALCLRNPEYRAAMKVVEAGMADQIARGERIPEKAVV